MNKGIFITIEGGEGSGKTTLIERLAHTMQDRGRTVLTTREPGGIPIAEKIRSVILDREHTEMDGRTEALLYAAARRQHLTEKVIPALDSGQIVICDRFVDSSLAYQGHARGLGMDAVWEINRFAIEDRMPQLTIYMDIDPQAGLDRINQAANREVNRLDLESLAFHERVREGYGLLLERYPERIVKVDAGREAEEVFQTVLSLMDDRFKGFFASRV
ncbi:dTMP kinase [Paenibacillus sp. NPDC058071]|uniref:dTMP kinase n=1 Tax=Paenibacillus sp. NPDC058071 TaxID=3346326 RepID=UPI0036D80156